MMFPSELFGDGTQKPTMCCLTQGWMRPLLAAYATTKAESALGRDVILLAPPLGTTHIMEEV